MKRSLAIIGAGLAGITLARTLNSKFDLTLFDKARGVGGRVTSRYAHPFYFDHAVQSFSIREESFLSFVSPLISAGQLVPWNPRAVRLNALTGTSHPLDDRNQHYVAVPAMNVLGKQLLGDIPVQTSTRIQKARHDGGWQLTDVDGESYGPYDLLLLTCPAPQAIEIIPADHPVQKRLTGVRMHGCFTMLIGQEEELDIEWDLALLENSILKAIYINHRKPARGQNKPSLVVHSQNKWADDRLDSELESVQESIWQEVERLTPIQQQNALYNTLQRWRYATTPRPLGSPCYFEEDTGLGICGDWCLGSRVENAFISARALSSQIIDN